MKDPYSLQREDVAEPPRTLLASLLRLGPGIVLAAAIVGSGELIATTTLGAQTGYTALWIILLSCAIKPVVQAELGRYTLASGETGLEALNRLPGPRWRVNWVVWIWAALAFLTLVQGGALFGAISQIMNLLIPAVPVAAWVLAFALLTLVLLLGGGYERIERIAMIKVALFTVLTLLAAVVLTRMPQYFTWGDALEGLSFRMPAQGLTTAVAIFGITGVGGNELFMYPYWCVEKGYARYVGRREDEESWRRRARGWIRVMHVDIGLSMVVYTLATVAFYLLGAGILHRMGTVPAEDDVIPVLSRLYTHTLGPWALGVFYLEALIVLYGTVFAGTAANARLYADFCRLLGLFERGDYVARLRFRRRFVILLTLVASLLYLVFESPIKMVLAGGLVQTILLPLAGIGAIYLRHRHLPKEVAPGAFVTAGLWTATGGLVAIVLYSVWLVITSV
jgi:Mn2+/Fe2+ NRAMP family transporter